MPMCCTSPPLLSSSLSLALLALLTTPSLSTLRSSSLSCCVLRVLASRRRSEEREEALLQWAQGRRVDLVVHVGWRKHAPRHCEGEAVGVRSHAIEFVALPGICILEWLTFDHFKSPYCLFCPHSRCWLGGALNPHGCGQCICMHCSCISIGMLVLIF
jgi:hypothetical protein